MNKNLSALKMILLQSSCLELWPRFVC